VTSRGVALGLGIFFALLTALELALRDVALGDIDVLRRTTKINIFHWGMALGMLGAFFTRSVGATRITMRVGAGVLLAMTLWGTFWGDGLGSFLGYADGIPAAYNVYHGLAGVLALSAGFLGRPRPA
jgi:hypothetical protein